MLDTLDQKEVDSAVKAVRDRMVTELRRRGHGYALVVGQPMVRIAPGKWVGWERYWEFDA